MKKIFLLIILFISAAVAVILFLKWNEYNGFKTAGVDVEEPFLLTIERGETWKSLAAKLEKTELVDIKTFKPSYFYYLVKEKKAGKKLKTGEFEFQGTYTPENLINKIISGKVKEYSFTIPEGYNIYDIRKIFKPITWIKNSDKFLTICKDKSFLKEIGWGDKSSCEGLLFPSTYTFPKNTDLRKVMKKMALSMKTVLAKYEQKAKEKKLTTYEMLILASVIEKETGVREEQPRIASVFFNRRRIGMPLQSDPTVIYGLFPKFNGNLTRKDLRRDHKWNSYTRRELPSTPIAMPGEGAIKSVAYPDSSKLLYFVATGGGRHYFSKTLKEHNAAVEWYQIMRRKRPFKYR